jgi:hypothetical protein
LASIICLPLMSITGSAIQRPLVSATTSQQNGPGPVPGSPHTELQGHTRFRRVPQMYGGPFRL